ETPRAVGAMSKWWPWLTIALGCVLLGLIGTLAVIALRNGKPTNTQPFVEDTGKTTPPPVKAERPPEPSKDTRAVQIVSNPIGATIVLDDQENPVGLTPFKGELKLGSHKIKLLLAGHQPFHNTLDVKEGEQPQEFTFDLTPIPPPPPGRSYA